MFVAGGRLHHPSVSMKMTDVFGCVGGSAFLLLASTGIPLIGPFLSLLTPLPFVYYTSKLGYAAGIKLLALSLLFIGLISHLTGRPGLTIFALELGIMGIVLAAILQKGFSLSRTIFLGAACMLLLGFGFFFFISLTKNVGPLEMILGYIEDQLQVAMKSFEGIESEAGPELETEAIAKAFVAMVTRIYPSMMILGTALMMWLNVMIAKQLFRLRSLPFPDFGPLDQWQAPERMVWGLIASGFSLFLSSGTIAFIALNALIVLLAIYFFQGLSIVLFFLNKYRAPLWLRVVVYFFIVIQQIFPIILMLAGLFDQWVDFRKIGKRAEQ